MGSISFISTAALCEWRCKQFLLRSSFHGSPGLFWTCRVLMFSFQNASCRPKLKPDCVSELAKKEKEETEAKDEGEDIGSDVPSQASPGHGVTDPSQNSDDCAPAEKCDDESPDHTAVDHLTWNGRKTNMTQKSFFNSRCGWKLTHCRVNFLQGQRRKRRTTKCLKMPDDPKLQVLY